MKKILIKHTLSFTLLCLLLVSVLFSIGCTNDENTTNTTTHYIPDTDTPDTNEKGEPHMALHLSYNRDGYATVTGYYWCTQAEGTHDLAGDYCFESETGTLTIPETGSDNRPIVAIYFNAFKDFQELKHVILPKGFKQIGDNAFQNCNNLKTVTLSDETQEIASYAFAGCEALESISPLTSLKTLGGSAFEGCKALKEIDLGSQLDFIGRRAFACSGLTSVTLPENARPADEVFYECRDLKKATITGPLGMYMELPRATFAYCTSLETVSLSKEIIIIGESAFMGSGLTYITLPPFVSTIHSDAFRNCSKLESISIAYPNGGLLIDQDAFSGCSALHSIYWGHDKDGFRDTIINDGNEALQNAPNQYYGLYKEEK